LDRTFHDLLQTNLATNAALPFGGKVIVLGGVPRQILPVVEGGTRLQIIDATIVNSPLWSSIQILKLTHNMRLSSNTLDVDARLESVIFSKWLLAVGEGMIPTTTKDTKTERAWIKIPNEMLLMPQRDHLLSIVQAAYPNLQKSYGTIEYLKKRAILAPSNEVVDIVIDYMVSIVLGDTKEYFSCDAIAKGPDSHTSLICYIQ
jgi:ATP-dependent DNA helicase PIF1